MYCTVEYVDKRPIINKYLLFGLYFKSCHQSGGGYLCRYDVISHVKDAIIEFGCAKVRIISVDDTFEFGGQPADQIVKVLITSLPQDGVPARTVQLYIYSVLLVNFYF